VKRDRRPPKRTPVTAETKLARRDAVILRAIDALEDGDDIYAIELLRIARDDRPIVDDTRCPHCRRWPGEQWSCVHALDCPELACAA